VTRGRAGGAQALGHLLATAAHNLRPGGYFFGVCPDGARVGTLLAARGGRVANAVFHLEWDAARGAAGSGEGSEFGASYLFALQDTVRPWQRQQQQQ